MPYLLVLYYSRNGSVARLAQAIAAGADEVSGIESRLRTVPAVRADHETPASDIPDDGPLYCTLDDLAGCAGLALGSPGRFGNMTASLKYFLEQSTNEWVSGRLIGKPAGVFTSTSTPHGGQESTLLSMMVPLLHHGMLISGIPFSEAALHDHSAGGTPYGSSWVAGPDHQTPDAEVLRLARNQGRRLAQLALRLDDGNR
ncbi:NAD(P)H:quinone oxidoreductase [Saccharospirillum sp. HFRX-1]|uniref:NAD(P)H:quinone oxidoreductase n=1 Tax=unclassified Saccharospirillum TaxID=2633430 RepID=UPI003719CA8A